ncbi:MAG TPA: hypothetical protein VIY49_20025 [Bryobacteraceae bacterium]
MKTSKPYKAPRTPWGDPDLQGSWPAQFNIPMSRPANLKDKEILSDEEFEQQKAQRAKQSAGVNAEFASQVTINPPGYWSEGGTIVKQTSMVVDPPDGRVPPLTPEARKVLQSERGGLGPGQHFPDKVDSWEDFDYYSRCITRGFPSTMLYTIYNYGNDIIQSPGYVVIRSEMVHEQRVIPVSSSGDAGRPHVGKAIKTYMGSSVGHWEGDTLVVETTNLRPESGPGARYTDAAKVVERFTRTAPDRLLWEATISDPNVWTRPFTLRYPFKLQPDYPLYEYACHEGNYMMLDALTAARQLEEQGKNTKVERGPAGGPLPGSR